MKRSGRVALMVSFAIVIAGAWLLWEKLSGSPSKVAIQPSPQPSASAASVGASSAQTNPNADSTIDKQGKEKQEAAFALAFDTPINFWGQVLDEVGKPITGATVKLGTANRPWEQGTSYTRMTDEHGLFSIIDARGLSISVDVSKEGYYQVQRSRGQINYAQPSGNKDRLPTAVSPMLFELRRAGERVPLITTNERTTKVPKDGTPIELNLATGRASSKGTAVLKVECWTSDQTRNSKGNYDWRCRLSIPGGGLVERTGQFDFEAPSDGYKISDQVDMPQWAPQWKKGFAREYFAKFSDDRYARFSFKLTTGGEHFFVVVSYINPNPGSRNLESDSSERISR